METLTIAKPELEKLEGKNIIGVWTIGSWYAGGQLSVRYRERVKIMGRWAYVEREARLHMKTLLPILKKYDFEMHPDRIYIHLRNPKKHKEKK